MKKVIVRTAKAGVHYGTLLSTEYTDAGRIVRLGNTRRIWSWEGARSLSELGCTGTTKPDKCNFSLPLIENELTAIETMTVTPEAARSIEAVPYWQMADFDEAKKVLIRNKLG